MPTLQEMFKDREALDLALHELIGVFPVGLHHTMMAEPRNRRGITTLKRMRDIHPEIGKLPTIMFRTGLAVGIIALELHTLLEEGGSGAVLRLTEEGVIVVDGPSGRMIRPTAEIVRILASELAPTILAPTIIAGFLWRSFVRLMCDDYPRQKFLHFRIGRGGTIRLLRRASASAPLPNN